MEQSRELRQLFDACTQGNLDAVTALLDSGCNVNATDEDDVTALQLAAANGQEQVVRLLLVRGAAVDQANVAGWTPLLHAARNGHTSVAALLIQNHASVGAQTCYGAGVACLATRSGNLAMFRLLDGAGVSFAPVVSGILSTVEITPLIVAAHWGHDSIIKHMLLSADVNYPVKPTGVTALMGASVGGHISTARLLVERGKANVDATDINKKCSLDYCIAQDKRQVKEYLEAKTTRCCYPSVKNTSPSITEAVRQGNTQQVWDILEGDISQRDACTPQDGATPLMFSAMLGHFDIAKLLVEKGCSVNAQDVISGWTALMQAIFHGQKEVAVYLIHAGADVTVAAKSGCTAFDMASIIGDVDTELYRLIAARAMPVVAPQLKRISHASSVDTVNHTQQKTGVKAWWSRISKRFHNLKQPENISSDRNELSETVYDATLRNPASTVLSSNDDFLKSLAVNPLTPVIDANTAVYHKNTDHAVRNDILYSLSSSGMITRSNNTATLKSVVPPIFPSPSFRVSRTSKMPPASLRKPLSNRGNSAGLLLARPVGSGIKLPQNQYSTLNLVNRVANPPPRVQFAKRPAVKVPIPVDVSPSASCDATTLGSGSGDAAALPRSRGVISSESSSTLTTGSDNNGKTSSSVELSRTHGKRLKDKTVNAKSNNGRATQPIRHKLQNSGAISRPAGPNLSSVGKDSCIGAEVAHREIAVNRYRNVSQYDQTDLGEVLQKLSLESYRPIFKEQEVDIEAFLTLTDCDLKELGIQSPESRRQILAAISEINANKDRERQMYLKKMANFSTSSEP